MIRLRTSLVSLVAWVLLPAISFAIATSALLALHEQETFERAVRDRNRAYMSAVDAEVRGTISSLRGLASARSLAERRLDRFLDDAARMLPAQPGWLNVILHDASGHQVLNVRQPGGGPAPEDVEPATVREAIDTRVPVVGSVAWSPRAREMAIAVRVPVLDGDVVRWVLTAVLAPTPFESLLAAQEMPAGWVNGLVDRGGRFIVRSPVRPTGSLASEEFRKRIAGATEGWYRGRTVEGLDTYTAHLTSSVTGWSNGIAVPADEVWAGTRRAAWTFAAGIGLCVAVASIMATRIGRRIARPITALAGLAPRLGQADSPIAPVATRQDIVEVAELARALEAASAVLRERDALQRREREALVAADRAKDEFLAMLSHELRNPLHALTASSAILDAVPPGSEAQVMARKVIARQTKHMARLVEDLLDVSRITTGKVSLDRETLDLARLARGVVDTWRESGRAGAEAIRVEGGPAHVQADRARMEQILVNLLDNATKFSPAGAPVVVRIGTVDGRARLAVVDAGAGIPADELPHVFELFRQGPQDLSRERGGMGVGLALVKRLAELHGGTVSAASDGPGQGTTVTVELPAVVRVVSA